MDPRVPDYRTDPELVLVVVLPVLLYGAALSASLPTFRVHLRSILLLSVGLTRASTLAVGVVSTGLVPGLGFAAACVLGAVVAPPDAVAATAIARNIRLPRRVVALIEGESLFNSGAPAARRPRRGHPGGTGGGAGPPARGRRRSSTSNRPPCSWGQQ